MLTRSTHNLFIVNVTANMTRVLTVGLTNDETKNAPIHPLMFKVNGNIG